MDFDTIKPAVKAYINRLGKKVRISRAMLYGSIVQGSATPSSDVDMIVISDDFAKKDSDERSAVLYRASVGFPYDLHVYGTTDKEFTEASPLSTLGQIRMQKTLIL